MEKKWLIRICLVVGVLFGISGVAMAANNVQMTSDVPNINKSSCGEAGNQYLRMDNATQIQEGDIIQFTLNNNSSLCKPVDYYLLLANDSSFELSTDTAEAVSTNHELSMLQVYQYSGSPTVYTVIPASTGNLGIDLEGDGSLWDVGSTSAAATVIRFTPSNWFDVCSQPVCVSTTCRSIRDLVLLSS
jgi:hypothetical protein